MCVSRAFQQSDHALDCMTDVHDVVLVRQKLIWPCSIVFFIFVYFRPTRLLLVL